MKLYFFPILEYCVLFVYTFCLLFCLHFLQMIPMTMEIIKTHTTPFQRENFHLVCFELFILTYNYFISAVCLQISDQPVLDNENKPDQPIIFDPKSSTLTRMTGRRQKLPATKPDTSGLLYFEFKIFPAFSRVFFCFL